MGKRFIRTDSNRYSRLGKKRKKLQVWRRARGKHSKIRRKRFSYPVMPTVGYKSPRAELGKIKGLKPILIKNLKDLELAGKDSILILARVGAKKKLELIKKAQEKNLKISNLGGAK